MRLGGGRTEPDRFVEQERPLMVEMASEAGLRHLDDAFPAYIEAKADLAAAARFGEDLLDPASERESRAREELARTLARAGAPAARANTADAARMLAAVRSVQTRFALTIVALLGLVGLLHPHFDWRAWVCLGLVAAIAIANLATIVHVIRLLAAVGRLIVAVLADGGRQLLASIAVGHAAWTRRREERRRHRRQRWASGRVRQLLAEYTHYKALAARAADFD
jgi:hypothetical protein